MPRFSDQWVLDRVLFDYVSGGSCACCGFQHFLPGSGTADLIGAVTDLETDQAADEIAALPFHPWPESLRDQIWADRVKLRQKMKREMPVYAAFWKRQEEENNNNNSLLLGEEEALSFPEWCRANANTVQRLLQLPRSEIMETLQQKYGIHSAFGVVLCAVMEQVANFELTQYKMDARAGGGGEEEEDGEVEFEAHLQFTRRTGFTLRILDDKGHLKDAVLQAWLQRMKSLSGPKLLARGKATADGENPGVDDTGAGSSEPLAAASSFASDRRMVRLLIARYWSDALMKCYSDEIDNAGR